MKISMLVSLLALAAFSVEAVAQHTPQTPVAENDWLYVTCGRGGDLCNSGGQKGGLNAQSQAKEEREVRCCSTTEMSGWHVSSVPGCANWRWSKSLLMNKDGTGTEQCFDSETYVEAQAICAQNNGYVCTKEDVESGCTKGSGCGHNADFIWTSDLAPSPPDVPLPGQEVIPGDDHMFLACGSGMDTCGGESVSVVKANSFHEVRCCSKRRYPYWTQSSALCATYSESELLNNVTSTVTCHHSANYAEAQGICAANNGYVCTRKEIMAGCAKNSGCDHNDDLVWTSNRAGPADVASFLARQSQVASIASCTEMKGRVWGDPHFITFDNLKYDCQGQGEFVIAMSKDINDPLAIHGRFVKRRVSGAKPTVTESLAIKVHNEVPIIHLTVPEQKVNGQCPFSFSIGKEETPLDTSIVEHFQDEKYDGKVNVFTNGKNVIFVFPQQNARVQVTAGGSNRCVINTNLCLTPGKHGATDIVGLLGSPDTNQNNDWMKPDGTVINLPNECNVPNPTNAQKMKCKEGGHDYCMENWCINDANNSLWSPATHALFNKCDDSTYSDANPDPFFADIEPSDAVVQACASTDNPDECELDTAIEVEEGGKLDDFVNALKLDDVEDKLVDNLVESNAEEALDGWRGPVSSDASTSIAITLPADFEVKDPGNFGSGNPINPSEGPGSSGDPHFKSWRGEHFEYHGQCDMVLTRDKKFADGLGLEVQIRTKLVRFWSYIKRATIRIGDDILEIEGNPDSADKTTHHWINFEYQGEASTIGGFPLSISSDDGHKRFFEIDLSSKFPGHKIMISSFREFVRVDFKGSTAAAYGNTVGMLGDFKTGDLLARDGVSKIDNYLELGNEWQLLPADDILFHDIGEPQFPTRCLEPEDPRGGRRRRLGESTVSVEAAEAACSKVVSDKLDMKDCVYDVLATQDLDMVGAF